MTTHIGRFGSEDSPLTHTWMALPFKIEAASEEQANEIANRFNKDLDELLKKHPDVIGDLNLGEAVECFAYGAAIAAGEAT